MKNPKLTKINLIVFSLLFVTHFGMAQMSFKVKLDTISPTAQMKTVSTPDGGFITVGMIVGPASTNATFLVKTDSMANIEWSKKYPLFSNRYLSSCQVLPLNSGGFYLIIAEEDFMFGNYDRVTFSKLDSLGNVLIAKQTNWGQLEFNGSIMVGLEVEQGTDDLLSYFESYAYDGFSNTCCWQSYLLKTDTNLNHVFMLNLLDTAFHHQAKICYLNGVTSGYLVVRRSNHSIIKTELTMLDTSGLVLWQKGYNYFFSSSKIIQQDSTFYILSESSYFSGNNTIFFHQIDYYGNTKSLKAITSTNGILRTDFQINDSSEVLLSGSFLFQLNGMLHPLIVKTDTSFQILNAKYSTDSLFGYTYIDKNRFSAIFTKNNNSPAASNVIFENDYFDNPSCSFVPITLTSQIIPCTDYTISKPIGPASFLIDTVSLASVDLNLYRNELCISSGINEQNNLDNAFDLFPNPANETVEIKLKDVTEGICKIRLINSYGKTVLVHEFNCADNKLYLDISKFAPGMYVLEALLPESLYKNTKLIIIR